MFSWWPKSGKKSVKTLGQRSQLFDIFYRRHKGKRFVTSGETNPTHKLNTKKHTLNLSRKIEGNSARRVDAV